jgi:hypothetical protein
LSRMSCFRDLPRDGARHFNAMPQKEPLRRRQA